MNAKAIILGVAAVAAECAVAGLAAAMAADGASADMHSVDVRTLQRRLVDFGVYLPNA